mgnify:CR=1 FL=1
MSKFRYMAPFFPLGTTGVCYADCCASGHSEPVFKFHKFKCISLTSFHGSPIVVAHIVFLFLSGSCIKELIADQLVNMMQTTTRGSLCIILCRIDSAEILPSFFENRKVWSWGCTDRRLSKIKFSCSLCRRKKFCTCTQRLFSCLT